MKTLYHVNNEGNVKLCRATKEKCRFEVHGDSIESTQVVYEQNMREQIVMTYTKTKSQKRAEVKGEIKSFDSETFYGNRSPREVQLDALNGVAEALKEDDSTQLIAACGTGKTYMHRQLLRQAMEAEGASGVGVILTSSIRLAHDTAADLRPTGGYDESLGKFGEDYEVVEVHSDARPEEGRQSVRSEGVISVDRIYDQIDKALASGKKVVIVSTYDSVSKVQEAQAKFLDQDRVAADLLIHDEAHNILGQRRPTTVANDENELSAYVGFHNDIPGSLQSKKRLYSTATPIVRETESDKAETGDLNDLIASAQKMQAGDQYERITIYSDNDMIGKVGGFISQNKAIESSCLAKPSYEIRETTLNGSMREFSDPVVDFTGRIKERSESPEESDLSPKTYAALNSTLNALVSDAEDDKNAPTNVLAYVGSIEQSESFKKAFAKAALHQSGGMNLKDAKKNMNSGDPVLRRQARMKLLARYATVKAAHSRQDSASVAERKEAFEMFEGNAVKNNKWTPEKRVLANVNIFSEGVSISEIDTVVISDDDKLNEKAMTQAIGRAIRVVPGNDVKKYGHVIIPSVRDGEGQPLNSSSVNLAAYTSTRVERGTIASKLRGETVSADNSTSFTIHKSDGSKETKLAREFAQNSVTRIEDLATATEFSNKHTYLLQTDKNYKNLSRNEQLEVIKSEINSTLLKRGLDNPRFEYLAKIQANIHNKSYSQVREMQRNGRVISNALSTGDVSSINPSIASKLISSGILTTKQKAAGTTVDEKREFLRKYSKEASLSMAVKPTSKEATVAHNMLSEDAKSKKAITGLMGNLRSNKPLNPESEELTKDFVRKLDDEHFVNLAFAAMHKEGVEKPAPLSWVKSKESMRSDKKTLDDIRFERQRQDAEQGAQSYTVDSDSVRKTGELNALALRRLLNSSGE